MFELLDDETRSPQRVPHYLGDPSILVETLLAVVAFGSLVLGDRLGLPRIARIALWMTAFGAGWWCVYRCFRRIEALWRGDPTRRIYLAIGSALAIVGLLVLVYATAIRFEALEYAVCGFSVLVWGVAFLRYRRRESGTAIQLLEDSSSS